jgi:hypothetical protein
MFYCLRKESCFDQTFPMIMIYNACRNPIKIARFGSRAPAMGSKIFCCGMVHQGISRKELRGATYDPGH